jgi:anhydro-N-acetylmuramic acid kinase
MSGTSTDGVDAALVEFTPGARPQLLTQASLPMPADLRQEFLALNQPGVNELERAALAGRELARLYARAVAAVLQQANVSAQQVVAIGAHGQTVRHAPHLGYTLQLNAPAELAEATGITVIADFRSRDIAAGGQGAPLVPAFHRALFGTDTHRTLLNLGGIANITILSPDGAVSGFDTGPANVLLDAWTQQHQNRPYDHNGQWAATGTASHALLQFLIESEPWLAAAPPKSTGRDLFNLSWLMQRLARFESRQGQQLKPVDVQATLQKFTAYTVAQAIQTHAPATRQVWVCGGGALNTSLMRELQNALACPIHDTQQAGVPVMAVEAMAFDWLAWAHENGHPAGLPAVTGARGARVLGCRYPA